MKTDLSCILINTHVKVNIVKEILTGLIIVWIFTALLGPILAFVHGMLYVIWLPGLVPLSLVGFSCLQHLLVSYFCLNDVRDLARVNPRSKLQIVLALASVIPIAWSMCLKSASHVALVYLLNLAHGALAWYLGVAALESERDLAGLASLRYNLKSA